MRFDLKNNKKEWEQKYELAKVYYEYHGDLEIPRKFRTINGYEYDENGVRLGEWLGEQRRYSKKNKLTGERYQKLILIGMSFKIKDNESEWEQKYELAKVYYEHHGDLEMPVRFKTINGYEYDENGVAIGQWLFSQKQNKKLSNDRRKKLELIGMKFDTKLKLDKKGIGETLVVEETKKRK